MAAPEIDPTAFRAFELAGWEYAARPYADHWGELTRQAIPPLLAAARVRAGIMVLDVACGPGWVSGAAHALGARPIGMDFAAAMVRHARQSFPDIPFLIGDADTMPFPDNTFDAVAMNFGLLHLARPEQALAEARRVVRPGGWVAFTVWAPPDEAVVFGIMLRSIAAHGDAQAPVPTGPPMFRYSEPAEAQRALRTAGLANPLVERAPLVWSGLTPDQIFNAMYEGTARTGGLLRRQSTAQLGAIRAAVLNDLRGFTRDGCVELPMPAVLAAAQKPIA